MSNDYNVFLIIWIIREWIIISKMYNIDILNYHDLIIIIKDNQIKRDS